MLWEPPFTSFTGERCPVRRAASSGRRLTCWPTLVAEDVRTLAFVRSRRGAEQVAMTAARRSAEVDPSLPGRVASVPQGLPARGAAGDRGQLRRGELTGLAATNALELGIDISGSTRC